MLTFLERFAPAREFEHYLSGLEGADSIDGELLASLPIAALLGLIERRQNSAPCIVSPPRFRPTTLVSLRSLISNSDSKGVIEQLGERFSSARQLLQPGQQSLTCILTDWGEELSLNETLKTLLALSETFQLHFSRGELLGPSLNQCFQLAERFSLSMQSLLTRFLNHGITGCVPGPRTLQEKIALELGMTLSIRADISFLADDFHVAGGPGEGEVESSRADTILLSRHVAEVMELREELHGKQLRWFYEPYWSEAAVRHALAAPFAVPVTKALLLARLLLPEQVTVDAHYPLVGRHLAQLLADYGVTSIGPVAVDPDTASALGIPLVSEVADLEMAFPGASQ